jgi:putative nucleotidyltransferase with HDIG domain
MVEGQTMHRDDGRPPERGAGKRQFGRPSSRGDVLSVMPLRPGSAFNHGGALKPVRVVPALLVAGAAGSFAWSVTQLGHSPLGLAALIAAALFLDLLAADVVRAGRRVVGPALVISVAAFVLYGLPAAVMIGAVRGLYRAFAPGALTRTEASCVGAMAVLGPTLAGATAVALSLVVPWHWIGAATFVICAFVIEVCAESLVLGRLSRPSIMNALERNLGWSLVHYLVLGVLGIWLGADLAAGHWIALFYFAVPLAVVRHGFDVFGGEEQYVGTIEHENSVLFDRIGQLDRMNGDLIEALAMAIDARNPSQAGHSNRVAQIATAIGTTLGIGGVRLETLRRAALLHDVGTLAISNHVTEKAGPLTPQERRYVQMHSELGARFVSKWRDCRSMAQIIEQHHERLDGSGYPRGLSGEEICLEARIVAVAETYVALTSNRAHREALAHGEAFEEIKAGADVLFDTQVIEALSKVADAHTADVLPISRLNERRRRNDSA